MINISVKSSAWRKNSNKDSRADYEFSKVKQSVVVRDGFTCQSCFSHSVPAKKNSQNFMEVHHKNDCHTDNSESNLITICPFCHSRAHFGLAHMEDRGFFTQSKCLTQASLNEAIIPIWFSSHYDLNDPVFNKNIADYQSIFDDVLKKDRTYLSINSPLFLDGVHLANIYLQAVEKKNPQLINQLSFMMLNDELILVPNLTHERYLLATKSWSDSIIKTHSSEKIMHWLKAVMDRYFIVLDNRSHYDS